jgi:hypothetical protein
MILALCLLAAVAVGVALGGRVGALADLHLRARWLIGVAIAMQFAAFPSGLLPWTTGDSLATGLWIASYGLLIAALLLNRHIRGLVVVAAGLLSNLVAILANGGHMPALPDAAAAAGMGEGVEKNSHVLADPNLAPLVDRWVAPDWVPLANVFSIGDVLLALGAFFVVLPAMGAIEVRFRTSVDEPDDLEPAYQ